MTHVYDIKQVCQIVHFSLNKRQKPQLSFTSSVLSVSAAQRDTFLCFLIGRKETKQKKIKEKKNE